MTKYINDTYRLQIIFINFDLAIVLELQLPLTALRITGPEASGSALKRWL